MKIILNATIDKANNLYRKELEWMRRQPKARTTKSKSRIDAFYDTEKVAKTNTKKQSLELDFEMKRLGKKILELKNINKSYGDLVLLKDFSYSFQRGEKVGIVGKKWSRKIYTSQYYSRFRTQRFWRNRNGRNYKIWLFFSKRFAI